MCVFWSFLPLGALSSCFFMNSFTSLSITPLVGNTTSKLNWTVHKNSTCYQLKTETVNWKIVNKALQWFQNKRSSHWRCSIKEGVFKNIGIFTGKHLSFLLINCRPHIFNRTPLDDCFWNKCTCENLKPELFHLRLLASLCNFNYLQSFVKAKFTVVKYNSKMSIIYHQTKFRKGIINRSSIKKLFLNVSQYSQKNNCIGVSF